MPLRTAVWFLLALAALCLAPLAAMAKEPSFADFDRRAKAGERLNVVFFGASLTWGANASDPQLTSFRGLVGQRLEQAYPQARFKFWDAAIGGTGSQLGVFRFERDVLRRQPDLVFLDFSANDGIYDAKPETLASYEALVRQIIEKARAPVVQVIFPFQWDVEKGKTDGMLRRDAHRQISAAYKTALGDAIELAQTRVKSGETTLARLWPVDGVHPCDKGYELFADAGFAAFQQAVREGVVCTPPAKMLHPDTYLTSARVRISQLGPLPAGWKAAQPNVVSAYFDMLMSRWLDDEVVAAAPEQKGKAEAMPAPERLRVRFRGTMAMLFGESTPKSGAFRAYLDGKLVERKNPEGKPLPPEMDGGGLGKRMNGNSHFVQVIVEGLEPGEHTLEIEPVLAAGQELRLESICVAGREAQVQAAAQR